MAICVVASTLTAAACSGDRSLVKLHDAGVDEAARGTPESSAPTKGRLPDASRTGPSAPDAAGPTEDGAAPPRDGAASPRDGAASDATHDAALDGARDAAADATRGRALWNGVDLSQWEGDPMIWKVVDGAIVGSAPSGYLTVNSFLIYREPVPSNFVLTVDAWLSSGNSGIQYRSARFDTMGYRIRGYQADMGATYWGQLYDEAARGTLQPPSAECLAEGGFSKWLAYEVRAEGTNLRHRIDGIDCVNYVETAANPILTGVIALQYHAPGGFEVRFRNLRIEAL